MAILIGLVIATIIITGAYVGYHAWDESLHEEVEKHSESIEFEKFQEESAKSIFYIQTGIDSMIA